VESSTTFILISPVSTFSLKVIPKGALYSNLKRKAFMFSTLDRFKPRVSPTEWVQGRRYLALAWRLKVL
jgi:hypothetical protein